MIKKVEIRITNNKIDISRILKLLYCKISCDLLVKYKLCGDVERTIQILVLEDIII